MEFLLFLAYFVIKEVREETRQELKEEGEHPVLANSPSG
jgi:hypothetical protein